MYSATTHGIRVTVEPRYMEERSDAQAARFFWAYTIEIRNSGSAPVQLLARHWEITDGNGRTKTVRGPGVVGEQPVIEPGASFDYVSGCPLDTPSGSMSGSYRMVDEDGTAFDVAIPRFNLLSSVN